MYSIIEQGGAQFKVSEGTVIDVPLIDAEAGTELTIDRVLLTQDGEDVKVGSPMISGASVTAKIISHFKGRKILVIKRKRRKDYRRKNGHRQNYTKIQILSIKG